MKTIVQRLIAFPAIFIITIWPPAGFAAETENGIRDNAASGANVPDNTTSAPSGDQQTADQQTADLPESPEPSTTVGEGTEAGEVRIFTEMKIPFRWCPPGKLLMGSPADEAGHRPEEGQSEVELTKGFWMQQHELTQENWNSIARRRPWEDADPYRYRTGRKLPADYIDWYEAMSYCQALTDLEREEGGIVEGQRYQLPTEAQWEYACRAGTSTTYSFGSDASVLNDYAWYVENTWDVGEAWPHETGLKKPNGWGIHDMHGNVWEWCIDRFVQKRTGGVNPYTTGSGRSQRTLRGGCWNTSPESLRSAARGELSSSGIRFSGMGFRMVLVLSADMELKSARTEPMR